MIQALIVIYLIIVVFSIIRKKTIDNDPAKKPYVPPLPQNTYTAADLKKTDIQMDRFDRKVICPEKKKPDFSLKMPVKQNESEKKEENKSMLDGDSVLDKDSVLDGKSVLDDDSDTVMEVEKQNRVQRNTDYYKHLVQDRERPSETLRKKQQELQRESQKAESLRTNLSGAMGQRFDEWKPVPENQEVIICPYCGADNRVPKHRNSVYHCYFCRTKLED